mmetsp:Transcript_26586/g.106457  ORF Transcript_26586/g.106457 Transcript_26586/m.106457 type:complete len:275 (+) Transcript_26586:164-988(+)
MRSRSARCETRKVMCLTASFQSDVLWSMALTPCLAYSSDPEPTGNTGTQPAAIASSPVRPKACQCDMSRKMSDAAKSAATWSRASVPWCVTSALRSLARSARSAPASSARNTSSSSSSQPNVWTTVAGPKATLMSRSTWSVALGLRRGVDGRTMATTWTADALARSAPFAVECPRRVALWCSTTAALVASSSGALVVAPASRRSPPPRPPASAAPLVLLAASSARKTCRAWSKADKSSDGSTLCTVTLWFVDTLVCSHSVLAKRTMPSTCVYDS